MIEVTAAIIRNSDNQILICQRPEDKNCALLWEFPGGKQEEDESLEECLVRECKEELEIYIKVNKRFSETVYDYPDRTVHITFFESSIIEGTVTRKEHHDLRWIPTKELKRYDFCPADIAIVERLCI